MSARSSVPSSGTTYFFGDGVGVAFYSDSKSAPRFIAFGGDAAVGVQRELGIDSHQFFVAQKNHRVRGLAARKAVLRGVEAGRQGIFQQAFECDFAKRAA